MMVMPAAESKRRSKRRRACIASGFYAWRHRMRRPRSNCDENASLAARIGDCVARPGFADRLANAMRLLKMGAAATSIEAPLRP
jgi:hypothetical protein